MTNQFSARTMVGATSCRVMVRGHRCAFVSGSDRLVEMVTSWCDDPEPDISGDSTSSLEAAAASGLGAFAGIDLASGVGQVVHTGGIWISIDGGPPEIATEPGLLRRSFGRRLDVWSGAEPLRPSVDAHGRLSDGSVMASGLSIEFASTSSAPVPPPPVAPSSDVRLFSLSDEDDLPAMVPIEEVATSSQRQKQTGEIVEGVRCSRTHFNDPRSRYCSVCGISMLQASVVIERAERPPLGVLIFADGSHEQIDETLVIGREPDDKTIAERGGRAVVLADAGQRLSRVHTVVRPVGWDVVVEDQGSTNGTFVWQQSSGQWNRLQQGVSHRLAPGDHFSLADVVVTFESGHQRG